MSNIGIQVRGHDRIVADLEEQLPQLEEYLAPLKGANIFVTGGTGYIGKWLLESLVHVNQRLHFNIQVQVLTRSPEMFTAAFPHLGHNKAVSLIAGDVVSLPSDLGTFDGIIHAATPASAAINIDAPNVMLDTIIDGGRAALALAAKSGSIPFLFTSSGAVYGQQPDEIERFPETYLGGPDPLSPKTAYHEGKRVAEQQCVIAHHKYGVQAKIARIFAMVGPYLPLDIHFAMGNFIGDTMAGRPIVITSDGSTVRSYLYGSEMATWLWAIFVRGESLRAYNVGSSEGVDMSTLARTVASCVPSSPAVEVRGQRMPATRVDRYVPDTTRIETELGVRRNVSLEDSIRRTIAFYS
jgi:nucleoside-diphosphate-sugar epimerase